MVALLVTVGIAATVPLLFHPWKPDPVAVDRGAEAAVARLVPGSVAPGFHLTAVDGRRYSSEALKGRPVILFAMFANCADCIPQGQAFDACRAGPRPFTRDGSRRRHRPGRVRGSVASLRNLRPGRHPALRV